MTPDELAKACADAMWADDHASRALGMRIVDVAPGRATVAMPVRPDMVNGHGTAHGGFAFACNSRNVASVAYHGDITYLAPAAAGDELVAVAEERSLVGRTGTYDVSVHAGGRVVAEFLGTSRSVGGTVL